MKAEKIRGLDPTEIQRQEQDAQEQLFRFRFQMGMGQNEGLKRYRALKKDRARMLTVLAQKQANGEVPQTAVAAVSKSSAAKSKANKKSK